MSDELADQKRAHSMAGTLVDRLRAAALPGTRRNKLDEEAASTIERLQRGEFICCICGLRKDADKITTHDF